MSTETKPLTPLTMSAEREATVRKLAEIYKEGERPAAAELCTELDAERAAHAATRERLEQAQKSLVEGVSSRRG